MDPDSDPQHWKNLLNCHLGWIRIRKKKQDPDPHQVKSRIRIWIRNK